MTTREDAIKFKDQHSDFLLGLPGVIGVGITEDASGNYGFLVHLEEEDEEVIQTIRDRLCGHCVKFELTGRYRKL